MPGGDLKHQSSTSNVINFNEDFCLMYLVDHSLTSLTGKA